MLNVPQRQNGTGWVSLSGELGDAPGQGGRTVRPVVQHTRREPADRREDLLQFSTPTCA
jgi:hypothetical protein